MPTFEQHSQKDLLSAAVGFYRAVCQVGDVRFSNARCADLAEAEILHRIPIDGLLLALKSGNLAGFEASGKASEAYRLLKRIKGPKVEAGLSRIARDGTLDFGNFLGLLHFADRCEPWALRILNENWWKYEIPSFVWAKAIEDFGKCNYQPATPGLIEALDAASLNAVDAAYDSLKRLYPSGPSTSFGPEAVKSWNTWISAHATHRARHGK